MPEGVQILIYDGNRLVFQEVFTDLVELGRQRDAREMLYTFRKDVDRARLVVAPLNEDTVSREHARVEPLSADKIRLSNISGKVGIRLSDNKELKAGQSCEMPLPASFTLGRRIIRLQSGDTPISGYRALPENTLPPGAITMSGRFQTQSIHEILKKPAPPQAQMDEVMGWLQSTVEVLQSAVSSSDFFQQAADAMVNVIGLDRGCVLLCEREQWQQVAGATGPTVRTSEGGWQQSQNILNKVRQEKRTFWQDPWDVKLDNQGSLAGIDVVVASPILDPKGQVIGVLYGDSSQETQKLAAPRVTKVEALVVEMLARGVAVGLARMQQEQAAIASRVRFEQFFTKELAEQLARETNLLDGRDAEVTLLFCDIRGFSRISEKLGPERTVRWISQVMEVLSDCVLRHQGVLVDYIGDELMAMWGAPVPEREHAQLASQAALDMLACLPELSERWNKELGEPTAIGIGLNTGIARVGNTGSRQKFKYGPLGNTVNLASRVQGATKYLGCPLLLTEWTRARLSHRFRTRKLCQVRVINIKQPVDLYELVSDTNPNWPHSKDRYEEALQEFTEGRFRAAARILGNLLADIQDDGPSLVLMKRAVNALVDGPDERHPVWDLPGK